MQTASLAPRASCNPSTRAAIQPLRVLFTAWGNPGNLSPLLTAARRLAERGHDVRILGDADSRAPVEQAGSGFAAWRRLQPLTPPDPAGNDPAWAEIGMMVKQLMFGSALDYALDTMEALRNLPTDILVTSDFLLGTAIAAEALGSPYVLLSPHVSLRPLESVPCAGCGVIPGDDPAAQAEERAVRARFDNLMNGCLPVLNQARDAFALPPLRRAYEHFDRVDRVLLGLSDTFDFPATRLPANLLFIPMVAPAAGAWLLELTGWRSIYAALATVGLGLVCVIQAGFKESAPTTGARLPTPAALLRDYAHVLSNPTCVGYILANAAAFGALFAYVSGSSLFFLGAIGLSRVGYSLVFAATSLGIMAGALATARLTARGVRSGVLLTAGALIALAAGAALLAAILSGWSSTAGLVVLLVLANLGFGLVAPNATNAALQPLPSHAGAVSVLAASAQVLVGSISSAWVVSYPGNRPGVSMATAMAFLSAMACLALLRAACVDPAAWRRDTPGEAPAALQRRSPAKRSGRPGALTSAPVAQRPPYPS